MKMVGTANMRTAEEDLLKELKGFENYDPYHQGNVAPTSAHISY